MKQTVVKADSLDLSQADIDKLAKIQEFIDTQAKLCLKRYFTRDYYDRISNIPALKHKSLELKVFWALQRDLYIYHDEINQKVNVLWRIHETPDMPQIKKIREYKNYYYMVVEEQTVGDTREEHIVRYDKEEFNKTINFYKEEIEYIRQHIFDKC